MRRCAVAQVGGACTQLLQTLMVLTIAATCAHAVMATASAQEAATQATPFDERSVYEPGGFSFSFRNLFYGYVNSRVVADVATPDALSYRNARTVADIAERWVSSTRWGGRVRVNEPYEPAAINIYLVRSAFLETHGLSGLVTLCPCEYLTGTNTILCVDEAMTRLTHYLDRNAPTAEDMKSASDEVRSAMAAIEPHFRSFLTDWVVAHEVGHVVLGHSAENLRQSWVLDGNGIGLDAERQADDFYLRRMQHNDDAQAALFFGVGQFLTTVYGDAIRAQYTKDEIASKELNPFATNARVAIEFSPIMHPPFIYRALRLYDEMLRKYPKIVDTSGYGSNIRAQIDPVAVPNPSPSQVCEGGATADEDEPLGTMVDYLELHIASGDERWAEGMLSRIRGEVSRRKLDAAAWSTFLSLETARARWRFKGVSPDWATLERSVQRSEQDFRSEMTVVLDEFEALAGRTTSVVSRSDLSSEVRSSAEALFASGAKAKDDPEDLFDLGLALLTVDFGSGSPIDDDGATRRDEMVGRILRLSLSPVERRLLVGRLATLLEQLRRVKMSGRPSSSDMSAARLASLIVAAHEAFGWSASEMEARQQEIDVLRSFDHVRHEVVANREEALAQMATTFGDPKRGMELTAAADADVKALEPLARSDDQRAALSAWRGKLRSNQAWNYLRLGRFADAKSILVEVEAGLPPPSHGGCDANLRDDRERGHVLQNLADAELGLGETQAAAGDAAVALACSVKGRATNELRPVRNRVPSKEWLDAAKTEGIALVLSGHGAEGQQLLRRYSSSLVSQLDDKEPPDAVFQGVYAGKLVDVRTLTPELPR